MKIVRAPDQFFRPYTIEHGVSGIERADLWRAGQDLSFDLFRIKKVLITRSVTTTAGK